MKRFLLTGVAVLVLASSAGAVEAPQGSRYDSRIQSVPYNEGDVVVLHAYPGLGSQIVFSLGEKILDIASGFSQGWEFSDRRNILYLKPKSVKEGSGQDALFMAPEAGKWDTNLLVTTNQRLYAFDLRLMKARDDGRMSPNNKVSYRVKFTYPHEEAAALDRANKEAAAKVELDRKAPPVNWNYSVQAGPNSSSIVPTMAYDDGRFTYLKFPNNRDFPAAFLVAEDGSESIVNSNLEASLEGGAKDILVIHRVAPQIVLRLGNAVVGVYNESYDPDGIAVNSGTTVPNTLRIEKGVE